MILCVFFQEDESGSSAESGDNDEEEEEFAEKEEEKDDYEDWMSKLQDEMSYETQESWGKQTNGKLVPRMCSLLLNARRAALIAEWSNILTAHCILTL